MRKIAADLHYFPNLEYFCALLNCELLILNPDDLYQRKSFFNRAQIRLVNKIETLSVPIVGRRPKIPLSQIEIDYSQNWQKIHLRGIQSAYGKAPFFEFIFPYIEQIFEEKPRLLWDLNLQVLTMCLKILQMPVNLEVNSTSLQNGDMVDLRGQLMPGTHFSSRDIYQAIPYTQNFGLDFEPNLSILDLLLNQGSQAKMVLQDSLKKH